MEENQVLNIQEPVMQVLQTNEGHIQQTTKAEIDIQIRTAKQFPREIKKFRQTAISLATETVEIAQGCFYSLTRGGNTIQGPSIRLAEICASSYKNLRCGSRVLAIDDKFITCQGVVHDLENNVAFSGEVKRKITNKKGERFSDDMIAVTANAGNSIALRNVIFKAVPSVYVKEIFNAVKKVAIGSSATLNERRGKCIEAFKKLKVTEEIILQVLNLNGIEEISLEHLENLIGMYNSIIDGDSTIEESFPSKAELKKSEAKQVEKKDLTPKQGYEIAFLKLESKNGKEEAQKFIDKIKESLAIKTMNGAAYNKLTQAINDMAINTTEEGNGT